MRQIVVGASRRAWLSVLAGGLALVLVAWRLPGDWQAPIWTITQLVVMGLATYALTRRDARHRSGWWVLLASCGLGVATAGLYIVPSAEIEISEWAWVIAIGVRYAVFLVGLILLFGVRRAQPAEQNFLDAGIVAVGLAIVAWAFLIEPSLGDRAPTTAQAGVEVSFAVLDLLMLSCVVRVLSAARSRTPTMLMLAAAGVLVLAADIVALAWREDHFGAFQPGGVIHAAWQLCGVLVAAAALHPSYSDGYRVASGDPAADALPRVRFVTFVLLAFLAPWVPVAGLVMAGLLTSGAMPALIGAAALTCLLLVLLVVRLGLFARLASRRADALNVQSATLVVQATALQQSLEEQEALQRELAHRAHHDPLTGLVNRAVFAERLERVLRDSARPPAGLVLIDLDGFKHVNDTLGHPVGDELLVRVAQRLVTAASGVDTIARLGGDEFALLLTDASVDCCRLTAARAIEAIREAYPLAGRQVYLAASAGLLILDGDRCDPAEALRDADLALYAAKDAGKNQVAEFLPQMRQARLRYAELAAGLRAAVAGDAFTVVYQPIVDLATRRPVALEALLRWRTADGNAVPPAQFISVAEDIGLVVEVGRKALRDACAHANGWYGRHGVAVSVNVSGRQLAAPTFASCVLATLKEHAVPPEALIVEITETVLVGTATAAGQLAQQNLTQLREQGIRIAVDDFGTGYSSLSYLQRLPIDILKIDHMFTAALESRGERGVRFVGAILGLGGSLGVPTVAEGVETAHQAQLLRELGCSLGQGYFFAPPCHPAEVLDYLDRPVSGAKTAAGRSR